MVEEPQGQGDLDGEIRVPPLPAPPAAPAGCPGSDRLRGQPHRHIAASNKGLIVGRPVRNAVLRLIRGMDLRLHPCSVAPAEDHEKCGPRRPTRSGYSCNNATYHRQRAAEVDPSRPSARAQRHDAKRAEIQRVYDEHHQVYGPRKKRPPNRQDQRDPNEHTRGHGDRDDAGVVSGERCEEGERHPVPDPSRRSTSEGARRESTEDGGRRGRTRSSDSHRGPGGPRGWS